MSNADPPPPLWRFGVFEADPATGELRKQGRKVRLPDQSFQVLLSLLEREGELVTRQELQRRLWPVDTFVDFEANLNTAISLLRDALGDSAQNPRFIETLPRRGYRFLGALPTAATASPGRPRGSPWWLVGPTTLAVLLLGGIWYRYLRTPSTFDSIAVLPLVYAGPQRDGDQQYLADGLTSALITELGRLGVPNVISETSAMRYKGARKALPEIARELGVDAVVEGTVVREGDTVRVNAQLIDARRDLHLWAQSYEREMASILELQDQIARAIAREIRPRLTGAAQAGRPIVPPVNSKAHEAYLRGRHALRDEVEERRSRSVKFFEEAIRLDPDHALAYAGLADYYAFTDALPPKETLPKAKALALQALELDERVAGAHLSLALVSLWGEWDWAAAERQFARAMENDPGDATARMWYALFLDLTGRSQAASEQLRRGRELDPVSPRTYFALGYHHVLARRYDEALEQIRKGQELSPHDPRVFEGLWGAHLFRDAQAEAIAAVEQGIALWGRAAPDVMALAVARARKGERDEARALLAELHGMARQRYVPPSWFALIEMSLGETDGAIRSLEAAFQARDSYLLHAKVSPLYDPIRGDARFQDLIRRLNLPERQGQQP